MARVYDEENKLALAEETLDEAITTGFESLGSGHPQVASLLELRADILSRRGEARRSPGDLETARVDHERAFRTGIDCRGRRTCRN